MTDKIVHGYKGFFNEPACCRFWVCLLTLLTRRTAYEHCSQNYTKNPAFLISVLCAGVMFLGLVLKDKQMSWLDTLSPSGLKIQCPRGFKPPSWYHIQIGGSWPGGADRCSGIGQRVVSNCIVHRCFFFLFFSLFLFFVIFLFIAIIIIFHYYYCQYYILL